MKKKNRRKNGLKNCRKKIKKFSYTTKNKEKMSKHRRKIPQNSSNSNKGKIMKKNRKNLEIGEKIVESRVKSTD